MQKPSVWLSYLLPQPRDILFIGVFYSMLFGGPKLFSNDGDLGRHIAVGNFILTSGTIPTRDIFSHTVEGVEFVPHEWLAQVIFALAHRAVGLNGAVLLAAFLASVTILIVYNELIKRGNYRLVALFVAAWVTVVSSVHWLARPHIFTFFFLTIWTYGLERTYTQGKGKWFLPLLMLIWANTHGAFFAGFVVWAAFLADWVFGFWQGRLTLEKGKQLVWIGALSFLVTLINPSGWGLWTTTVGYVGNEFVTSHIVDHLSPNFHEPDMWPFLLMIAFALLTLMQDRKLQVREALLLAGWTVMGLHTVRNVPLFAVVTAPIYGGLIQHWVEAGLRWWRPGSNPRESENRLHGYVWATLATLGFSLLLLQDVRLDQKGTGNIFLPDRMPVQAVDWLQENPQAGNMFNSFTWGGYILYRLWPEAKVFIDGQVDVYGEAVFRDYLEVISLEDGWEELLDTYDVSWMIIPNHESLAEYLISDQVDDWVVIYKDDTTVILRRQE